jgi:hypothetical protein
METMKRNAWNYVSVVLLAVLLSGRCWPDLTPAHGGERVCS